jgi:predicted transcriptional regulator
VRLEGRLFRSGKWWAIEVPVLNVSTQGQTRNEAYEMIADAIEMLVNVRGFQVTVIRRSSSSFEITSTDPARLLSLLLKRQRQAHGLSLNDVADRLGMRSRNAYARYEQARSVPTLPKLEELLKAVNPNAEVLVRVTEGQAS